VLILRDWLTEGESLERMVIRSNYDVTAAAYVQLPTVQQAIAGQGYRYKPDNERHVAPKTPQPMAELHGVFDAAMGAEGPPAVVQPGRQGRGDFSGYICRRSPYWSANHPPPVVAQRTLGDRSQLQRGIEWTHHHEHCRSGGGMAQTVDLLTKMALRSSMARPMSPVSMWSTRSVAFVGPTDVSQQQEPLFGRHRMVHEFGDTKYRKVEYYSVATTRFREYFPPAITKDPANIT
jgi:hypothetical protein